MIPILESRHETQEVSLRYRVSLTLPQSSPRQSRGFVFVFENFSLFPLYRLFNLYLVILLFITTYTLFTIVLFLVTTETAWKMVTVLPFLPLFLFEDRLFLSSSRGNIFLNDITRFIFPYVLWRPFYNVSSLRLITKVTLPEFSGQTTLSLGTFIQ